jgi:outer membrane protein, heavy metal efflux system
MKTRFSICLLLLALGVLTRSTAQAQGMPSPTAATPIDTLALTLPQAEALFLQKNLSLLAQRYNITAAEAQIQQARVFDNPVLYLEQNVYRPRQGEMPAAVLPAGYNGETIVTVQQLLRLAGKRRALANVAEANVQVEQFTFQNLLRTLRFQLRTAFYELYFARQSMRLYDDEIASFQKTVDLYQGQFERGNVALKEVIRLRAFLIQLQNERQQVRADIAEQQTTLHTLLSNPSGSLIRPLVDKTAIGAQSIQRFSLGQLLDSARLNRPDLRQQQALQTYSDRNLTLQRKLAVPDLSVGYTYDRQGSYIRNYNAVSVSIPLALFNRNQGNIRTAEAQAHAQEALVAQQQATVAAEVQEAFAKLTDADRLFRATNPTFSTDFDRLLNGISDSYARRNLSLVEYLDFLEAYKNNVIQRNQLQRDLTNAYEELEYVTNARLFR